MEELEQLIEEVERLRIKWHELSNKYQHMNYGTAYKVEKKKCQIVKAEYDEARKRLSENMQQTYYTDLKEYKLNKENN